MMAKDRPLPEETEVGGCQRGQGTGIDRDGIVVKRKMLSVPYNFMVIKDLSMMAKSGRN